MAESGVKERSNRLFKGKRDARDIQKLMDLPEGRRFIRWLLRTSNFQNLSYVSKDVGATNFNEGMRRIGVAVYDAAMNADERAMVTLYEKKGEDQDGE